jgi:hypothetical protein
MPQMLQALSTASGQPHFLTKLVVPFSLSFRVRFQRPCKKLLGFSRIWSDSVGWEVVETAINPDKQNRDLSAFGELGTSVTRQRRVGVVVDPPR